MAVPDPDMDELRIISYESRTRECRKRQSLPHRNDFKEVLWCLDHIPDLPEKWCPAEVLHITACPEQDFLAQGVILYPPDDNWDDQVHTVDFLSGNRLRRTTDDTERNKDEEESGNTALEWKYSSRRCGPTSLSDEEWIPPNQGDSTSLGRASMDLKHSRAKSEDIKNIRDGHAALSVEVQKLKRNIASLSSELKSRPHLSPSEQGCFHIGSVLSLLRYKLALKAQGCLRNAMVTVKRKQAGESDQRFTVRTEDGLHVGTIRVKVDCTLREFEDICRLIKARDEYDSITFTPGFAYTQFPSQRSAAFRILFSTFADLATHPGISSKADRLELVRKCGMGSQGDILRMLGTYAVTKSDTSKPVRIYPGESCGTIHDIELMPSNQVALGDAAQHYPVLMRKTREWNTVDKRFIHDVYLEDSALPHLSEEVSEEEAFQIHWRRGPELTGRSWWRALANATDTMAGWKLYYRMYKCRDGISAWK